MTARDFVDWTEGLIKSKGQKLVGDITGGYHYMDTDKAIEMQERINKQLKNERAAMKDYCENDVRATIEASKRTANSFYGLPKTQKTMKIKSVIFNDPATIVIWKDGSKTVVKCGEGDTFDPEKGLAMAIAKRVYGDKGSYYKTFKKWLPEEEYVYDDDIDENLFPTPEKLSEKFKSAFNNAIIKKD